MCIRDRIEGNPVDMDRVLTGFDAVCVKYDYVTAEGSGGILCPPVSYTHLDVYKSQGFFTV